MNTIRKRLKRKAQHRSKYILETGRYIQDGTPSMDSAISLTLEQQADNDFYSISGITPESLSGSISPMSGKDRNRLATS